MRGTSCNIGVPEGWLGRRSVEKAETTMPSMGSRLRTEIKRSGGENGLEMTKGKHKCPVCGMMVGDTWSAEYEGKTYYFMNAKHREIFLENPTRFVK
jgi:YHS domain-containing protein